MRCATIENVAKRAKDEHELLASETLNYVINEP